ncbi:hypothetical protein Terro_2542 [Terriglobus roseus DSM 18391]|uniref:TonB-dependent transporter Oar-like beta-barrel domain-containing protein n=1 Tax=Terriglobus roseus (strain DSM 18391 / NRRL B-41598 / KBS 63) TaxID=926566 RepID=I3ZHR9_TERRK|nr:hypothetical protein Terro_2178 [Terriglobus roseus DSM 18391]AFL88787.1 hypothetical protein Terro_2542 [Terriglobus roseus DSM 18391]
MYSYRRIALHAIAAVALAPLAVSNGFAQTLYGGLTGVVTDSSGSVVPGAKVTVTNPATGLTRTDAADSSGAYQFTDLPPGTYGVVITAPSFGTATSKSVPISANQSRRFDATLTVGNVTETVEVNTVPPALQTERADVNYEISPTQVQELPTTSTAGRNFQGLYRLIPGVPPPVENNSQAGNPGRTQAVTANGIVNTVNSTKIDGAAVGYPWLQSIVAYIPPTDSIESANIVTNSFNAEQGAAGGIAANLIVKSGTNRFHGGAWAYNSIAQFNARQYFTRVTTTPILPKNIYNEFGGNIGGPIIRDKLFFFFGYNRVSLRQFKTGGAMNVPLAALRGGNFAGTGTTIYDPTTGNANGSGRTPFPGNVIPTGRLSPATQKILALLPTEKVNAISGNYPGGAVLSYDRASYDTKISYNPTDKTTFFGRYSIGRSQITDPPALGAAIGNTWDGGQPGTAPGTIQNIGLGATHSFTSNFLIDANAGFVRINLAARAPDYGTNLGTDLLGISGTNGATPFQSGLPGFLPTGLSSFGNYIQSNPFQFRDMQYVGNLNGTYLHGKHNFRFGGEYVHSAINHLQANNAGPRGQFTFTGGVTGNNSGLAADGPNYYRTVADMLLGLPQAIGKTVQLFQPNGPRFSVFSFYAQDTWKATPNLTINYGLRYEYYPFANRDHTGVFRFDPATSNVLIGGRGNTPTDTGADVGRGQLVPRFGINYRINEKTVIRAGGGITVDPENYRFFRDSYPALITLNNTGANNYVAAGALTAPNAGAPGMNTLPSGALAAGVPTVNVPNINTGIVPLPFNYTTQTAPQKWRRGYIEAYNLFIDRDLAHDVVLNIGYVGTHHVRQVLGIDINAGGVSTLGAASRPLFANATAPGGALRYTGTILNVAPAGDEEYSGMQLQISDRQLKTLQFGYSYTWSHYLNYWDADSTLGTPTFSTPGLYKRNFASSGFDRTHMNSLWTVYKIPFGRGRQFLSSGFVGSLVGGWDLNTITTYYSGRPFQITDSSQAGNGDTVVPNQISQPVRAGTKYQPGSSVYPYYIQNQGNYAKLPNASSNGNTSRNSVRGPGYFNLDVGLTRNIPIYRELAIILKAESFDVTNTPQWSAPVANVNDSGFGQIQSVLSTSNRTLRFSGRISF